MERGNWLADAEELRDVRRHRDSIILDVDSPLPAKAGERRTPPPPPPPPPRSPDEALVQDIQQWLLQRGDWCKAFDADSGSAYFYNPETRATTWNLTGFVEREFESLLPRFQQSRESKKPSPARESSAPRPKATRQPGKKPQRPASPAVTRTSPARNNEWRDRVVELYEKHNPSKLIVVDELLLRYRGREEELWRNLKSKYSSNVNTPEVTPRRNIHIQKPLDEQEPHLREESPSSPRLRGLSPSGDTHAVGTHRSPSMQAREASEAPEPERVAPAATPSRPNTRAPVRQTPQSQSTASRNQQGQAGGRGRSTVAFGRTSPGPSTRNTSPAATTKRATTPPARRGAPLTKTPTATPKTADERRSPPPQKSKPKVAAPLPRVALLGMTRTGAAPDRRADESIDLVSEDPEAQAARDPEIATGFATPKRSNEASPASVRVGDPSPDSSDFGSALRRMFATPGREGTPPSQKKPTPGRSSASPKMSERVNPRTPREVVAPPPQAAPNGVQNTYEETRPEGVEAAQEDEEYGEEYEEEEEEEESPRSIAERKALAILGKTARNSRPQQQQRYIPAERRPAANRNPEWEEELLRREQESAMLREYWANERQRAAQRKQSDMQRKMSELQRIRDEERALRQRHRDARDDVMKSKSPVKSSGRSEAPGSRQMMREHRFKDEQYRRSLSAPGRKTTVTGAREFDTSSPIYSVGWKYRRVIEETPDATEAPQQQNSTPRRLTKAELEASANRLQRHYSSPAARRINGKE